MTSHCYPLYCKNISRVPYVERISAGKNNDVDFIYQFVKHTKHDNHKWRDHFLIGAPTKFPKYGDFPRIFSMRTYGFDISISSWQDDDYLPRINAAKSHNYIDILFYEAVYPIRVSIYEIYNPGNIIKIWAQDSDGQWCLLWEGTPQIVPPTSRLFSPPLQSCNFKTKKLKLEFKSSKWDYYTKLDAVMLIGTSELIVPKNCDESLTNLLKAMNCMYNFQYENEDIHNLTTDYENPHLDIVFFQENFSEYCIRKSDLEKSSSKCNLDRENVSQKVAPDHVQRFIQKKYLHFLSKYHLNSAKRMKLSSDEFMELSCCNFYWLPDEIILKVLKNLDLRTLCRMSQVNKHFNILTYDYRLYTCLTVRWVRFINPADTFNVFDYFTPRCKYLQKLDLTDSEFSGSDFEKFLNNCGKHLTHLRLNKCISVDNTALFKISKICKNLKKLYLRCEHIDDRGFLYLENLEHLEDLSICDQSIFRDIKAQVQTQTLCKILQKNQQIRELHLEMKINERINLNIVTINLKNLCPNLEVITLIYCPLFGLHQDINHIINALADCKNIRKIRILHTDPISENIFVDESLNRLFSSCQCLEEVYLSRILSDRNLNLLTQCKNLKSLYLMDVAFVTSDKCSVIFEQCTKLQELYLISCEINKLLLNQWRKKYPHVSILVKTKNFIRYQREWEFIDVDI